jgi:hypothetical protein
MEEPRTKWGRVRFGGGRLNALAFAAAVGLPLAVLAALGAWGLGAIDHPAIGLPVFSVMLTAPATALVYALVVDRATMSGAPKNPEESVENAWYDRAAQKAFHDVVLVVGLTLFVIAIADIEFDAMWALVGVLAVAAVSFGIRYRIMTRRDS